MTDSLRDSANRLLPRPQEPTFTSGKRGDENAGRNRLAESLSRLIRQCGALAVGIVIVGLLLWTIPSPAAAWSRAGAAIADGELAAADRLAGGVSALVVWLIVAWLAAAIGVTWLAALPGRLGQAGHTWSTRIAPQVVRRGIAALLGITLTVGVATGSASAAPVEAVATPTGAVLATPAVEVANDGQAPNLDWPLPNQPRSVPATSPAQAAPVPQHGSPPASESSGGGTPAEIFVQSGDSLWNIAARQLGAAATSDQIATEWPRWWAANRDVIGNDPDVLQPGWRLQPPA